MKTLTWGGLLLALACASEPPPHPGDRPVIEVAPFTVLGGGEPWSGLGLAEHLRQAVGRVPQLQVRAVGDSVLRSDYILRGTVARRGARNEIGVEIVRALDAKVIWTGTYWRAAGDLGEFAGELAGAVLAAVGQDTGLNHRSR